jgi:hypothetical protein
LAETKRNAWALGTRIYIYRFMQAIWLFLDLVAPFVLKPKLHVDIYENIKIGGK